MSTFKSVIDIYNVLYLSNTVYIIMQIQTGSHVSNVARNLPTRTCITESKISQE